MTREAIIDRYRVIFSADDPIVRAEMLADLMTELTAPPSPADVYEEQPVRLRTLTPEQMTARVERENCARVAESMLDMYERHTGPADTAASACRAVAKAIRQRSA